MLTDAQKAVLTKDELSIIEAMPVSLDGNDMLEFAKSLADARIESEARRMMLKQHEWRTRLPADAYCPECGKIYYLEKTSRKEWKHYETCALDALAKEE